ncbi:MAG: hypothetical protein QN131_12065, partial [Armatimonadota bacterium]|nr:hypothetical protein [Armatimonadota bacterium]
GPVLGAGVVHAINDRLSGPGLGQVSEVVMGLLLMVVVATLPEGIYGRVKERGVAAGAVGAAVIAVATALGTVLLDALAIGVAAAVILLVMPRGVPRGRRWGRGHARDVEVADG